MNGIRNQYYAPSLSKAHTSQESEHITLLAVQLLSVHLVCQTADDDFLIQKCYKRTRKHLITDKVFANCRNASMLTIPSTIPLASWLR